MTSRRYVFISWPVVYFFDEFIVYNDVCCCRRQQGDGRKQHEHEYGVSFTYKQPCGQKTERGSYGNYP